MHSQKINLSKTSEYDVRALVSFFELLIEIDRNLKLKEKIMKYEINNIQIVPVQQKDGLVAFASFVLNDALYCSSIAIHSKLDGSGYRLTYPNKKAGDRSSTIFHPLTKELSKTIEEALLAHFKES